MQSEIATLHERNVELLEKAEKKSKSDEQQLQAQQASMRMQLIQQASLETEKFSSAVQEIAAQVSIKKAQLPVPVMQGKQKQMQQFVIMINMQRV